ncbi:hypothetical protein AHAS_Ahas20G0217500 [Arachis hypogaea]
MVSFPKETNVPHRNISLPPLTSSTSATPAPHGTPPSLHLSPPSPPSLPLSLSSQTHSVCFRLDILQSGTTGPPKMYRKMSISLVRLQV